MARELCSETRKLIAESRNYEEILHLSVDTISEICDLAITSFKKESTLLEHIEGDIAIVGDLHGNIDDLLHITQTHGTPSESQKYLFLGDYVDRGECSIETFLYLICLKVEYPDYVFMIRGNHEFKEVGYQYGFAAECLEKYGISEGKNVFDSLTSVFPYLPLAAVVQNEFFAVHGGISSRINTLDDIRSVERFSIIDYKQSHIVTDLVWGDPCQLVSGVLTVPSNRGVGEDYSVEKVRRFLMKNQLTSILRAHEACKDGFDPSFVDPETNIPICITIFSASNYCHTKNRGAVALLNADGSMSIEQHESSDYSEYSDEDEMPALELPHAISA